MEFQSVLIATVIVTIILVSITSWLTSADVQCWLQHKYYNFRIWRIKRKNKKNEWKWGDEKDGINKSRNREN